MANLIASQPTDLLYVPEVTEDFAVTMQQQFVLLMARQHGEPLRIEYLFNPGQDAYDGFNYYGSSGFMYGVTGIPGPGSILKITPAALQGFDVANDGFGLRQRQFGGNDSMQGSPGSDRLLGFDGNDTVFGNGGDDDLNGNRGNDLVYGGDGADFVRGGQGVDFVIGGAGDDWHLNGNIGNDTVGGGDGNDTIFGGPDRDFLYGEAGNDVISGDLGNDRLIGSFGNDTMSGGPGFDQFDIFSSNGDDLITDFQTGTLDGDIIAIGTLMNGVSFADFATVQAHMTPDGAGGTILDLGAGNSVHILGVLPGAFVKEDFFLDPVT